MSSPTDASRNLETREPTTALDRPIDATEPRAPGAITFRSLAIGAAGAVFVVIFQLVSKAMPQTAAVPLGSVTTIFPGVVLCLTIMALANVGLRRWRPRAAFRPGEFAVVFAMVTVAASIGAQDEAQFLLPMLVYPFRQSMERDTRDLREYIPHWYIPRDPAVVEPYYQGQFHFWDPAIWRPWVVPLLVWTG